MPSDPAFEALWKQVVARWDQEASHRAFLEYGLRSDQLVEAARRYRSAEREASKAAAASQQLKAISVLALTKLESARTPRHRANRRAATLLGMVLLLTALAAILFRLGATMR